MESQRLVLTETTSKLQQQIDSIYKWHFIISLFTVKSQYIQTMK